MPDLADSLQGRDLGHLMIIAGLWGVDLGGGDARSALLSLAPLMLNRGALQRVIAELPSEARLAIDALVENGGRLPWSLFSRRYGALREMGSARRDREKPYLDTAIPTEMLWYRGLVGRGFLNAPSGAEEFAYIPDDLLDLLPRPAPVRPAHRVRPASPGEQAEIQPAGDSLLDYACSLLAARRSGLADEAVQDEWLQFAGGLHTPLAPEALGWLCAAAGLLDEQGTPRPEELQPFLQSLRGQSLYKLFTGWLRSPLFNELKLLPGLSFDGQWANDPLHTRSTVLDLLTSFWTGEVGEGQAGTAEASRPFWSLASFVTMVHQELPDFQRPAGDYDTWFIRRAGEEAYLRGFEHWDEVDGALLRLFITGPLHWLGVVDLAAGGPGEPASAFRLSSSGSDLLARRPPAGLEEEKAPIQVHADGRIHVPRLAPRSARYQVARYSQWEGQQESIYHYRLAPGSLERARQQGLRPGQLLAVLRRYSPLTPPVLQKSLLRWEEKGCEARMDHLLVLRLDSPQVLQELRQSPAARFIQEPLGPTAVVIKPGGWEKVRRALADLGYLVQVDLPEDG